MRNQRGITLIALVITIIVLLILAGVSIAMLTGDNGILSRASQSADETAVSAAKEAVALAVNEALTKYYANVYVDSGSLTIESAIDSALGNLEENYTGDAEITYSSSSGSGSITIKYGSKTVSGTVSTTDGSINWTTE